MATTKVGLAPMKVAQISKAGGEFEIVEREIPKPGAGHVLIKVQACGVCHSDVLTKEGLWPGIQYPRIPGHEVAGVIEELLSDQHRTANMRERAHAAWKRAFTWESLAEQYERAYVAEAPCAC